MTRERFFELMQAGTPAERREVFAAIHRAVWLAAGCLVGWFGVVVVATILVAWWWKAK